MKILQVAPHFFPYVGGQESYIHNLSKNLVKMGMMSILSLQIIRNLMF